MKPCEEFHHLILEGEPHELRGEGDSRLAIHLRACTRCARAAATVVSETERLDAFLRGDPRPAVVDAVLARAGLTGSGTGDRPSPSLRPVRRGSRGWATRAAAAAAVAALLLLPGRPLPPGVPPPIERQASLPTVETMSGQRVAVLETDNPDITVLWFF